MKELMLKTNNIDFTPGVIKFNQYNALKEQAIELSEFISSVVVTEDTVKVSKKLLAKSRAAIRELNDERIRIKKELLKPYDDFAIQIKEIENIVNEANEIVDKQVKNLEEAERLLKEQKIREIWENQTQTFEYKDLVSFENWFENRHLNKGMSLSKIEAEMADWLAKVAKDLDYLSDKDDKEYIVEYLNYFDVTEAMSKVEERQKAVEKLTNSRDEIVFEDKVKIEKAIFEVIGTANIKLAEMLFNENKIEYRKV